MVNVYEDLKGVTPFNFPMTEIQACVGFHLLDRVKNLNNMRNERAKKIIDSLKEFKFIKFQNVKKDFYNCYHLLPAYIDRKIKNFSRDKLIDIMSKKYGIQLIIQYHPLDKYHLFKKYRKGNNKLKNTYNFYNNMFSINQYEKHVHNSTHYKTSFNLTNIPVYVANSIRRALSSMVPTITFDDAHYEDMSLMSIKISKNTSALHDQFLSHRISYIPINMDANSHFNIETKLNSDTGDRAFVFGKSSNDIRFKLSKKNNISQNTNRDKRGLIDVTTADFVINDENGGRIIETGDFFKPDVFTGDYVLLNKLTYLL